MYLLFHIDKKEGDIMFQEEVKKILRSPLKWVLCAVLLLNIFIILINYFEFKKQVGDVKAYNVFANQYEGELDNSLAEQFQNELSTHNYADADGKISDAFIESESAAKAYFYADYCMQNEYRKAWKHIEGESEQFPVSYDGIEAYIQNTNKKGEKIFPIMEKEYFMLKKVGAPNTYYNMVGINKITRLLTGGIISFFSIMIAIVVIVNASFSIENSSNMISIILSTSNGRKRILHSKIIVVQIVSFLWISIYYWIGILLNLVLYDNFDKLSAPLNNVSSFYMSPYDVTIGKFFLICYVLYVIGGFAITSIFSVLSLGIKNIVMNFGVSLVGYMFPLFLPTNGVGGTIAVLCPNMSMQANMLFQEMQAINIGGNVVMLWLIAPVVSVLLGCIMYFMSYRIYLKCNIE